MTAHHVKRWFLVSLTHICVAWSYWGNNSSANGVLFTSNIASYHRHKYQQQEFGCNNSRIPLPLFWQPDDHMLTLCVARLLDASQLRTKHGWLYHCLHEIYQPALIQMIRIFTYIYIQKINITDGCDLALRLRQSLQELLLVHIHTHHEINHEGDLLYWLQIS